MSSLPALRGGERLEALKELLASPERINMLTALLNGLCNSKVQAGPIDRVFVSEKGFVFQYKGRSDSDSDGQTILLQTDGVDNDDQTLLNLVAGDGIELEETDGDVTISATGGGSGMAFRGIWDEEPDSPYMSQDVVVIQEGVSMGTYVSVQDDNENDPTTGIGWVQIAPGNTMGAWV